MPSSPVNAHEHADHRDPAHRGVAGGVPDHTATRGPDVHGHGDHAPDGAPERAPDQPAPHAVAVGAGARR